MYADVFTDDQFTQLVEEGADLQAEQERLYDKKKRRRSRASARKAVGSSSSGAAESLPPPRKKTKRRAPRGKNVKAPELLASSGIDGAGDAEPPESSLEL